MGVRVRLSVRVSVWKEKFPTWASPKTLVRTYMCKVAAGWLLCLFSAALLLPSFPLTQPNPPFSLFKLPPGRKSDGGG